MYCNRQVSAIVVVVDDQCNTKQRHYAKIITSASASHHMQFHAVPKPKIACASFACKRKFLALISILPRESNHVLLLK